MAPSWRYNTLHHTATSLHTCHPPYSSLPLALPCQRTTVEQRQQRVPINEEDIDAVTLALHASDQIETLACSVCGRGDQEDLLLICEDAAERSSCLMAAHTFCIGLGHEVPAADWYCTNCDRRRRSDGASSPASYQHFSPRGANTAAAARSASGASSPSLLSIGVISASRPIRRSPSASPTTPTTPTPSPLASASAVTSARSRSRVRSRAQMEADSAAGVLSSDDDDETLSVGLRSRTPPPPPDRRFALAAASASASSSATDAASTAPIRAAVAEKVKALQSQARAKATAQPKAPKRRRRPPPRVEEEARPARIVQPPPAPPRSLALAQAQREREQQQLQQQQRNAKRAIDPLIAQLRAALRRDAQTAASAIQRGRSSILYACHTAVGDLVTRLRTTSRPVTHEVMHRACLGGMGVCAASHMLCLLGCLTVSRCDNSGWRVAFCQCWEPCYARCLSSATVHASAERSGSCHALAWSSCRRLPCSR